VLDVVEDADHDRRLMVIVELAPGEAGDPQREQILAGSIRTELRRLNSEFAHYVPHDHQTPTVELRPAGDPEHFPPGVKHRYTRGR
jgi:phenylacetate-CoA ligase